MASINLIESFQDFKEAENIDRPTLMKVLEDVFKTLLRKKYGSDESFDVIVNTEKGDLEIVRHRMENHPNCPHGAPIQIRRVSLALV